MPKHASIACRQQANFVGRDIGKKLKEASGEPRSTFFLTQRISMAVQRGNSSCILNTVPPSMGLESIFEFISVDPENPENSDK